MDSEQEFIHAALYDPAKAHAYYIRNRKLKGRKAAAPKLTSIKNISRMPAASTLNVQQARAKQIEKGKRDLLIQVQTLKKRLDKLHLLLQTLKQDAQKTQAKAVSRKAATTSNSSKPKKQTAAQKQNAARTSKQYRATHKTQISQKQKENNAKAIKSVQQKITDTEHLLKASIARAIQVLQTHPAAIGRRKA